MDIIKSKIAEVAEEIKQCKIETSFNVRWEVIKMHNFVGKLLVDNFGENLAEALPTLARKCGWSDRSLYRSAQFYREYPDIEKIPGGKSVSFNSLMASNESKEEKCHRCLLHCPKL